MTKSKFFITDPSDRRVSKREFIQRQEEGLIGDCVLQSLLIKNKVLTVTQIKKLVEENKLVPLEYKSKIYYKKDAVLKAVKELLEPPKPTLFS